MSTIRMEMWKKKKIEKNKEKLFSRSLMGVV
jgi:hypothetical protein